MATRTKPKAADAPAVSSSTPEPKLFDTAMAQQAIKRWDTVHDFALTATQQGAFARVRLVDLSDGAMLNSLPNTLLERVLQIAADIDPNRKSVPVISDAGVIDLDRAKRNVDRQAAICDAYCIAGFVQPPLIVAESDRTAPDQVLLRAIHPADRQRFFQWCQGRHTEAPATVTDFPAARELADGVADRGSGGMAGDATEPAAASA